ncbi:MAG: ParB/RepB/Spo0J family partition protein [Clostridia bacterium]|nr:ParB/RepB/Spo0J family partition protein [Clostridia bacterium]
MLKSNASKIELKLYDDLFETDESRAENALSKIRDIPIVEIDDFPDHPFKVRDEDDDMTQLTESIKERGIITPATVRQKEDGRYELISGHRRKRACELAGMETLKAEVKELSRDDAIILMVDSNLQRSTILPSERAFSYKMRLDAMKRQAGRPSKENSVPVGQNFNGATSRELLAEKSPDSNTQIQRYIRLTYLIPEILEMVDEKRIAFRPAVEISFLPIEQQNLLVDAMEYNDATPSLAQSIKMRDYSSKGQLNEALIESIMEEEKPNQRIKSRFDERITQLIPKNVPKGKESDFVVKALEYYKKFLERNNRER